MQLAQDRHSVPKTTLPLTPRTFETPGADTSCELLDYFLPLSRSCQIFLSKHRNSILEGPCLQRSSTTSGMDFSPKHPVALHKIVVNELQECALLVGQRCFRKRTRKRRRDRRHAISDSVQQRKRKSPLNHPRLHQRVPLA